MGVKKDLFEKIIFSPAKLVVLSAGEMVGAGEAERRRSDTLPEGLAVPTLEDIMDQLNVLRHAGNVS